jgi:ankyrin repeat protein
MKNRKNRFLLLVATILSLNFNAFGNHVPNEDLVYLTGKYLNLTASQISNQALRAYDGKDLPKGHNGRTPDFLSHKTRHYRVTINSFRTDRVPMKTGPQVVAGNGQKVQKRKTFHEGDELEIMGLIAISPLGSKNNYRQQDGGNDIIFSRDLRGDKLVVTHLNQKTRVNRSKDYYIRNDKVGNAGFRLKFALLEYDKKVTKEEPFIAAHYDVKVGSYNWKNGTIKRFEKRLANVTNDQVITVFFTIELIKQISEQEMFDAVCSRNVGHTERLIKKGGNPDGKRLIAYAAKNCDENMLDLLVRYGAIVDAKDLQILMKESHYDKEAIKLLVRYGAIPTDREIQRAIDLNQEGMVHYFLKNGACPTEANLRNALKRDQRNIAYKLIKYNAPVSEDVLELAIYQGDIDLVNLILSKGIRPNSKMLAGCVKDRNYEMTRCLLAKIKPDHNALMVAVSQNSHELFALLIENGGYLRNNDCIDKAIDFNNYEIVNLGLRNGGNVNAAMEYAIRRNNRGIVQLCLDRNANPNLAFPFAVQHNDQRFFEDLLYRYGGNADDGLAAAVKANHIGMAEYALRTGRANPNGHIRFAADNRNEQMVRMLVEFGANPNPAMLGAVKANNTELVTFLVDKGAETTDPNLLTSATENGNFVLVEMLIDRGANPNDGMTNAVRNNHLQIAEFLLWKGALVSNYIAIPAAKGLRDMAYLLLEYGADPDEAMKSAVENDQKEIVQLLLNYGARTEGQLANPAGKGDRELVQLLLDGGANPNEGMKAAVENNRTEIVEILLNKGARVEGYLERAIAKNNGQLVTLLLERGANPNEGMSLAVQKEKADLVERLLDFGAEGSKIDYLKTAVDKKNTRLITLLAKAGGDVNHKFADGRTLIHIAAFKAWNYPAIRALIEAGARLNVFDQRDNTPLHLAVKIGKDNYDVIRLLVENGANVNAVNQKGESIRCVAKHGKVKRYLKKNGAKKKGWN